MNMQINMGGCRACFYVQLILVKPDLHKVVTIAQHACDPVLKRVLKLSTYRLQHSGVLVLRLYAKLKGKKVRFLFCQISYTFTNKMRFR